MAGFNPNAGQFFYMALAYYLSMLIYTFFGQVRGWGPLGTGTRQTGRAGQGGGGGGAGQPFPTRTSPARTPRPAPPCFRPSPAAVPAHHAQRHGGAGRVGCARRRL